MVVILVSDRKREEEIKTKPGSGRRIGSSPPGA